MEDDETDFTPSPAQNTSSNLATLFGFTKKPLLGNSTFTYTAPKAPKRESSPAKKQSDEKTKGKIIFSKAVQAYRLENRCYVNQGLIGIVISGNHDSRVYDIILYKRTKEHLCQIRISGSFSITLSPNNYASFYDNNRQNWSVMFQSPADVEQFSQKVAICKFFSQPASDILIQDLAPASRPKANPNSLAEVTYSTYTLIPEELSKLKEGIKEKINLSDYGFVQFSKGLIGCSQNCKRVVIIPHSLSGPWFNELGPNKDLLIEVKIDRINTEETLVSESPVDSSAEETIIKAKGATLKDALTNVKSHKANLISRMARMGQATLPVKPELSAGASDSEDEHLMASYPKSRLSRNKNAVNSPLNISSTQSSLSQNIETQQQVTIYQNDMTMHQKLGAPCQQLIPVSSGTISSPTTDPNMSVFLSESRIQAAELRMGISKVSEKVDLVLNRIQNMSEIGIESKSHQPTAMDPTGILGSIQSLIAENKSLKEKIEEQRGKIEQQSDRIFHLLELNHRYLEQNSTSHEKQSANESKLKLEMESLQRKELEMETANKVASERMKNLEGELSKSKESNKELIKRVEELTANTEALKKNLRGSNDEKTKELEILKEKITKAAETIAKFKDRLREVLSENESLKSVIQVQKTEIETGSLEMKDSKTKNEVYEKTVESLKKQISEEETKTESKIESLSKAIAKLEEEKKCLIEQIEKEDDQKQLKIILPKILSSLKARFIEPDKDYSAPHVLTAVEEIFNDLMCGKFRDEKKVEIVEAEAVIVPTPRTSLQDPQSSSKDTEESESPKEERRKSPAEREKKENGERIETDDTKKKDEVDSRYKSYDQGWRTARPPPPPLFDDDEEDDDWLV